ncbi:MAG: hypothetical protein ACI9D5_001472 [Candidatus Endobugula sp.]|jgi:hypothetical protein
MLRCTWKLVGYCWHYGLQLKANQSNVRDKNSRAISDNGHRGNRWMLPALSLA